MNNVEISYNLEMRCHVNYSRVTPPGEHWLPEKNRIYNIAKFYFKCYSFSMLMIDLPLTLSPLCEDAIYADDSLVKHA